MARPRRKDVFFMSLEDERKTLFPLYHIYNELARNYIEQGQDDTEQLRKDFLSACYANEINLKPAHDLASRLLTEKWYCVYVGHHRDEAQKNDSAPYCLITSDNPETAIRLTPTEYPDFYATVTPEYFVSSLLKFWNRARPALHIPREYVYINIGALEVLLAILSEDNNALAPRLPAIFSRKVTTIEFPLDKLNSNIWKQPTGQLEGQIALNFEMGKKGENAIVFYSIDFEALERDVQISKRLEPYDKLVYMAVSALFNSGCDIVSLSQVYASMGYEGRPSATDLTKMNNAITKMMKAHIVIDNMRESKAHKSVQYTKYDASLLPCERISGFVNGQLTEGLIHIFREPPVMSFAKERRQITTIKPALLQSPISKTSENIQIEDYLINRISKMKNGTGEKKILLTTLYENVGITTTKQKQRAPEKIRKVLDFYKKNDFIKGYSMDKISLLIKV